LILAPLSAVPPGTDCDQVIVTWVDQLATPPPEVLARSVEVVMVAGHEDSPSFRAAHRQTAEKWTGRKQRPS
jgi:hypothetical protein